jgi:hypothetical protein
VFIAINFLLLLQPKSFGELCFSSNSCQELENLILF